MRAQSKTVGAIVLPLPGRQRRDQTIFAIARDQLSDCGVEPYMRDERSHVGTRVAIVRRGIPRGRGIPQAGFGLSLVGSALALALATVAASYLPSRRAARVDPALTLRGE